MGSAVTVIFGANSTQFKSELAKMQAMTIASSRSMASAGHMVGTTGIVRESVVIGREAMMGRGIGRIIGSLTLLAQYINSATRAGQAGATASRLIADAYADEAVKAGVAAAAAMKKAEASAVAAEMDGFEDEASIAAADANAAEAATANAAAAALSKKAEAAAADAAMQEADAAATATNSVSTLAWLGSMALRLGLLIVIVVEAIIIMKELKAVFDRYSEAAKAAANYTREHTLAVWEEVAAMDKMKEASLKTTEAIHKMNVAKDRSVELAKEAIEASKSEAEARAKLYDANVKGKLLDIEIAEKKGLITNKEATRQKAAIESQSVTDKAAAKQAELDREAKMSSDAAAKAEQDKLDAQTAAAAASDKINSDANPEAKRRVDMLSNAEKNLGASKSEAEKAVKDRDEFLGSVSTLLGTPWGRRETERLNLDAETKSNAAASAQIRADSLKRFMSPDEIAAATAMSVAGEKTGSALSLKETARKAGTAASINAANSPAEVAEELANITKKMRLDLLPSGDAKGYSLNSQQKIGAYAATAPVLLQQLNVLRSIDHKVSPIQPPSNHPPGERKPQLGTAPGQKAAWLTAQYFH